MGDAFIVGRMGLGDNVYQIPIIEEIARRFDHVYLRTPYPQLYHHIPNLRCEPSGTTLRCQRENEERQPAGTWTTTPQGTKLKARHLLVYSPRGLLDGRSIGEQLGMGVGVRPGMPTLPVPQGWVDAWERLRVLFQIPARYLIVRPVTRRVEWDHESRNPWPEYVSYLARTAMSAGYFVVSLASLQHGAEAALEPTPDAHVTINSGLRVEELVGAFKGAVGSIGAPGFALPLSAAVRTPHLCVMGGSIPWASLVGGMGCTAQLHHVAPDPFCACGQMRHPCEKTIDVDDLQTAWERFEEGVRVGCIV